MHTTQPNPTKKEANQNKQKGEGFFFVMRKKKRKNLFSNQP
jgi:hypothetical protein